MKPKDALPSIVLNAAYEKIMITFSLGTTVGLEIIFYLSFVDLYYSRGSPFKEHINRLNGFCGI